MANGAAATSDTSEQATESTDSGSGHTVPASTERASVKNLLRHKEGKVLYILKQYNLCTTMVVTHFYQNSCMVLHLIQQAIIKTI